MKKISYIPTENTRESNEYYFSKTDFAQRKQSNLSDVSENLSGTDYEEGDIDRIVPEEKRMNGKTYLAWRMRNPDLFNNPHSSKSSHLQPVSNPTGQPNNRRLLERINEISNRLEREDIDSDYIKDTGFDCKQFSGVELNGNETDAASNLSLREFERIESLYNKVFSSNDQKFQTPETFNDLESNIEENMNYECNSRNYQTGVRSENYHQSLRNNSPKKVVSFEQSCVKAVPRRTNRVIHNTPNEDIVPYHEYAKHKSDNHNQHPVINYRDKEFDHSVNRRYDNFYKDENPLCLPAPKYTNGICEDEFINGKDSFKTCVAKLKSSKCRKYSPERKNYECSERCCHRCKDMCGSYKRDNHFSRKSNTNASDYSSSESENQADMNHHHKTYKSRKKKKITIDELYKIVKLQNEQITLLQKQIDRLLEQNVSIKNERMQKLQVHDQHEVSDKEVCACQQQKYDKVSSQGFTLSVVQENSKIGHQVQQCDKIDGNNLKKNSTNVSIGVMTSFVEITQKMQSLSSHQCNTSGTVPNDDHKYKKVMPETGRCHNQQPIKKADEDNVKRFSYPAVTEESFTLNEVDLPVLPVVNEHVPTPQCSLHLDIQDYGSTTTPSASSYGSSNNDSDDESENANDQNGNYSDRGRVGWTLYDNVVDQINKILQTNRMKQPNQPANELPSSEEIRTATVQQLKRLGVSFVENDIPTSKQIDRVNDRDIDNYVPEKHNENGFDVRHRSDQMPLEFANEDQILQAAINIMNKRRETVPSDSSRPAAVGNNPVNGNSDLSFATMKYMKRYRLLPGSNEKDENPIDYRRKNNRSENKVKNRKNHSSNRQKKQHQPQIQRNESRPQNLLSNKILDITALKQQPKLL